MPVKKIMPQDLAENTESKKAVLTNPHLAGTISKKSINTIHRSDFSMKLTVSLYNFVFKKSTMSGLKSESYESVNFIKKSGPKQIDYKSGFGGKFGVQNDRVDKSALGWDHVEKVEKHDSQKDYKSGFGGKFGVQTQNDKSALGWDHVEKVEKHDSQKGMFYYMMTHSKTSRNK